MEKTFSSKKKRNTWIKKYSFNFINTFSSLIKIIKILINIYFTCPKILLKKIMLLTKIHIFVKIWSKIYEQKIRILTKIIHFF